MTVMDSIKLTAEQYLQLGEDPPGVRLELVNGEIQVSPSPTAEHAFALVQLLTVLSTHIKKHRLGLIMSDTDHIVTPYTVRRPDLYYFSRDRVRLLDPGAIRLAPDLAVEVISPSSVRTDRKAKFKEYAKFGIPHYWLLDPRKKTIEAFALADRKYIEAGAAEGKTKRAFAPFPTLRINLPDLWWPPKL
jgi:Uma2 family endonuclease